MHFLAYLNEQDDTVFSLSAPNVLCVGCETGHITYLKDQLSDSRLYAIGQHLEGRKALSKYDTVTVFPQSPLSPRPYREIPETFHIAIIAVPWRIRHIFLVTEMVMPFLTAQARLIHRYHVHCVDGMQALVKQYLEYYGIDTYAFYCHDSTLLSVCRSPANRSDDYL